jgi:Raf kinase inhibitor-like YbhB/YbcL family protein
MAMSLKTPAFKQNGHIPSKYTCEAEDASPPLAWEGVPNGAKSLVLIIDDTDAPDPRAPKMVWVHWVVYNMPPDTKSLPEDAGKAGLPQGACIPTCCGMPAGSSSPTTALWKRIVVM